MRFFRLLHEILREIFDEAAYERFCVREESSNSRDSYATFIRQRQNTKPRPRCC
jgi:hypothetical protein